MWGGVGPNIKNNVTKPLVGLTIFVGRFSRTGKPTLIDATPMRSIGIPITWCELDSLAWMEKTSWHPGRRKPEQTFTFFKCCIEQRGNTIGR